MARRVRKRSTNRANDAAAAGFVSIVRTDLPVVGSCGLYTMLSRRRLPGLFWLVCSLSLVGCDPVRTTSQLIRLQVVDSASGQPVVGAQVSLVFDEAAARPLSKETELTPQEWKKRIEAYQRPGFRGITNNQGQAEIDAKFTSLDRTSGSKPPSGKDFVTGHPYLIKVKAGEVPEEEISLVMKAGASVKGKSYTVLVIDIQEPRYVET
jgi:hypothetical protein